MLKKAFLLIFVICTLKSFGQPLADDSVTLLINNAKTAIERIKILNDAAAHLVNGDLKKSFSYSEQARRLAIESNDSLGLAYALLNSGKYYTRVAMYDRAMKNYIEALTISEQKNNESLKGLVYKIIGNNYYFKSDYKTALDYYKRALKINDKLNHEETKADLKNNIALIFINSKQLDSALLYLNEAIEPYQRLNKSGKLANTLLNIGIVKKEKGELEEAIDYFDRALKINRSKGLSLQEGVTLNDIASVLILQGKYVEANEYVKAALVIGERENFKSLLVSVYSNLAITSKGGKDLSLALDNLLRMKDSLYSERNAKLMEEIRTKYEFEKTEQENAHLIHDAAIIEEQLFFVRSLLFFLGIFAIVVTVLAIIYYKSLLQNRRDKHELTLMNERILLQNEAIQDKSEKLTIANNEIAKMNENLQTLIDEKTSKILEQNERFIEYAFHNSHRVRGPLTRILGLVNLVKIGAIKQDEISYMLNEIDNASKELDNVLKEINNSLNSVMIDK